MEFIKTYVHYIKAGLEIAGVTVIALGTIYVIIQSIFNLYQKKENKDVIYHLFRKELGKAILLGLEFLVAADIINSVAVEPTLKSVGVLGMIVLVRTFLSFALGIEMNGRLPWKQSNVKKD